VPSTRALALALLLAALPVAARAAAPGAGDGGDPLAWRHGNHRVRLLLETRARSEWHDQNAGHGDGFYALRSRAAAHWTWRDGVAAFVQVQDARIRSLSPRSSGAAARYRRTAEGGPSRTHGDHLRNAWLEWRPRTGVRLRVGRQDLELGGEPDYPEPTWRVLTRERGAGRLLGTAGWTHAERAYDGASLAVQTARHHAWLFAARPTTGAFDLDDAYRHQSRIHVAGGAWTLVRDRALPFGELRVFGLWHRDARSPREGGLAHPVEVGTLGASATAVLPLRSGRLDLLAWGAVQAGDFAEAADAGGRALDHRAFAFAVEMGHQWRHVPAEPWLRAGIQLASGDDDPRDGDHGTFFAGLPSSHRTLGLADRLAFQNAVDAFAELRLEPLPALELRAAVHWLRLHRGTDAVYTGWGAYDREVFGFETTPSGGRSGVGTELDLELAWRASEHVRVAAGYAHLFGRGALHGLADEDVRFAYAELRVDY